MKSLTKKSKITLLSIGAVLLSAIMVLSGVGIYLKVAHKDKAPIVEVNPLDFSIDKWDGTSSALNYHENYANRGVRTKTINSASSFIHFINEVNSGYTYENYTIYLNTSIDLQGKTINSIGTEENPFKGTFDGGFYTIYNANINGNGLFAHTDDATISNVGLYNCNTNLIDKAVNTNIENCFIRLGNGNLANEYVSNNGKHYIKNSFVDSNAEGLVTKLNSEISSEHLVSISNSYYTLGEKAIVNASLGSFVYEDKVIKPVGKANFSTWDYSVEYDATKTWCDYDYLANTQELDFNYPLQAGFVKVYLTGSCYENIVKIGSEVINATNFQQAFDEADKQGEAEINLIVEKVFMEAQATIDNSNVKINPVVDTEIVRGENNKGSMFVSAGSAKLELGSTSDVATASVRNSQPVLTIDGNREYVEQNNLESSALIVAFSDVEVHENVEIKNNVNNTVGYGGAVICHNVTRDINIKGKIENCYAENGGAVAYISSAEESEIKSLGTIENCSAKLGGGLYIGTELPAEAVQQMHKLYGENINIRPMADYDNQHRTNVTEITGDDTYTNCTAEKGGAIYNAAGGLCIEGNATFKSNKATHGYGGAIYVETYLTITGGYSTFESNIAQETRESGYSNPDQGDYYGYARGGAVYSGGDITFMGGNASFKSNFAMDGYGDGLSVYNSVYAYGGAIYCGGNLSFVPSGDKESEFIGNGISASNYGGSGNAVYVIGTTYFYTNVLFDKNTISYNGGPYGCDVYSRSIYLQVMPTFVNTQYSGLSGAIQIPEGADLTFENTNVHINISGDLPENVKLTFIGNSTSCLTVGGNIPASAELTFIKNSGTCLSLGEGATVDENALIFFLQNSGTCLSLSGNHSYDFPYNFSSNTGTAVNLSSGTLTIDKPMTFDGYGISLGSSANLVVAADVEFKNIGTGKYAIYGSYSGSNITVNDGYTLTFNNCYYGISGASSVSGTMEFNDCYDGIHDASSVSGTIEFNDCDYAIYQSSASTMNVNGNVKIRGGSNGIYNWSTYSTLNLAGNIDIKNCSSNGVHIFWYSSLKVTGKLIIDGCSYGIYSYGYLDNITIDSTAYVTLKNNTNRAIYAQEGDLIIKGNLVLENNSSSSGYEIAIKNGYGNETNTITLGNDIDVRSTNGATTFFLGCYDTSKNYGSLIKVTTELQNVYSVYKGNIKTYTTDQSTHATIYKTEGVTLSNASSLRPFYVKNMPSGATLDYNNTVSGAGVIATGTQDTGVAYAYMDNTIIRIAEVGEVVAIPFVSSHSATVSVTVGGPAIEYIGPSEFSAGYNLLKFKAVQEGLNGAFITITCNGNEYYIENATIEVLPASEDSGDSGDSGDSEDPADPEEEVYPEDKLWVSNYVIDMYTTDPAMPDVLVHFPDNYTNAVIKIETSDNTVVNVTTSSSIAYQSSLLNLTKYLEIKAVGSAIISISLYEDSSCMTLIDKKKVVVMLEQAPSWLDQTYFEIAIGEELNYFVNLGYSYSDAVAMSSSDSSIMKYDASDGAYGSFDIKDYFSAGLKEGYVTLNFRWASGYDGGYGGYMYSECHVTVKVYDPDKRMNISSKYQEVLIGGETNIKITLPDAYKNGYVKFSSSNADVVSCTPDTTGATINLNDYVEFSAIGDASVTVELYSDSSCSTLIDSQVVKFSVVAMRISATEYYMYDKVYVTVQVAEQYSASSGGGSYQIYISKDGEMLEAGAVDVSSLGTTFSLADDPFNLTSAGTYTIDLGYWGDTMEGIDSKTLVVKEADSSSFDFSSYNVEALTGMPVDVRLTTGESMHGRFRLESSDDSVVQVSEPTKREQYGSYEYFYYNLSINSVNTTASLASYLKAVGVGTATITVYSFDMYNNWGSRGMGSFTVNVSQGFCEMDYVASVCPGDYLGSITAAEDDLYITFSSSNTSVVTVNDSASNIPLQNGETINFTDYISAATAGSSEITITINRHKIGETFTKTYTLNVESPRFEFNPSGTVNVQLDQEFNLSINNTYGYQYFFIESSNPRVISVSETTNNTYNPNDGSGFYYHFSNSNGDTQNLNSYLTVNSKGKTTITVYALESDNYTIRSRSIQVKITDSFASIEDVPDYVWAGEEIGGTLTANEDGMYVKFTSADGDKISVKATTISGPDNNSYHAKLDEGESIYLKDYLTAVSGDYYDGLVITIDIYRTSTGEVETQTCAINIFNPWFSVSTNNAAGFVEEDLSVNLTSSVVYLMGTIESSNPKVVRVDTSSVNLYSGETISLADYVTVVGKGTATLTISATYGDPYPLPPYWTETITVTVMDKFVDISILEDLCDMSYFITNGYSVYASNNYLGKVTALEDDVYVIIDAEGGVYGLATPSINMPNGGKAHFKLSNGEFDYIHKYLTPDEYPGDLEITISAYSSKNGGIYEKTWKSVYDEGIVINPSNTTTYASLSSDAITVSPLGTPNISLKSIAFVDNFNNYFRLFSSNSNIVEVVGDLTIGEHGFEYHFKSDSSETIDLSQYLSVKDVEGEAYITVIVNAAWDGQIHYKSFQVKVTNTPLIELESTTASASVGGEIDLDVKAIYGDNTHITISSNASNIVRVATATGTEVNGVKSHFTINNNVSKSVKDYLTVVGSGTAKITVTAYYPTEDLSYELTFTVTTTAGKLATPVIDSVFAENSNGYRTLATWSMATQTTLVSITYKVQLYKNGAAFGDVVSTNSTQLDLYSYMNTNGVGAYSFTVTAHSSDNTKYQNSDTSSMSSSAYSRMVSVEFGEGISSILNNATSLDFVGMTLIQGGSLNLSAQVQDMFEFVSWTASDSALIIDSPSNSTTKISLGTASTSTSNITLTAEARYAGFTVTFSVNYDEYGTVSESSIRVKEGASITVNGSQLTIGTANITATPTAKTIEHTYSFVDWSGIGTATTVTRNMMIVANFSRQVNSYVIKFSVHSDSIGYGEMSVPSVTANYGTMVSFEDNVVQVGNNTVTAIPTAETTQYVYKFAGWDGKIEIVNGAAEIFAHFTRELNTCTVTFAVNNSDYGSVVETTSIDVTYNTPITVSGSVITIDGVQFKATPTIDSPRYDYEFVEWQGTASNVTDNITITAVFSRTERSYKIEIVSSNTEYGVVSVDSITLPYGAVIAATDNILMIGSYYVTALTTEDTAQYDYQFTGWDLSSGVVDSNKKITANFTRTEKVYTVTIAVNDETKGEVTETSIDVLYGSKVVITDNVISIGGVQITATAKDGYKFTKWVGAVGLVEGAITIRAHFDVA